jgi:folate-binding protein YgfZ
MPERYAAWLERDVFRASGPEATDFLQGQLSQDVAALGGAQTAWSWVLAPSGKVDALVRAVRVSDDDWLLDTDVGWGDRLVTRLDRFKLRTKVTIERVSWAVLGLRGDTVDPETARAEVVAGAWPGMKGADYFGEALVVPEGWRLTDEQEYEAARITAGMPRMGFELDDKTIPGETGLNDLTVSFTKGCYTGQELVARIDSRGGNVARRLCRMRLSGEVPVPAELHSDGNRAGVLTSAARSSTDAWVGLGYVRRGIERPVNLTAESRGRPVEVEVLPS